ncbi:MAG: methylase of polypeptide chain release factor [Paucimonas sp.]|nr:methylase of polypeptide chain release factor [Paucimonas sp.]
MEQASGRVQEIETGGTGSEPVGDRPMTSQAALAATGNDPQAGGNAHARINPEALLKLGQLLRAGGYRFTTVTPASHAVINARPGNEWATDVCGVFGWSRPFRQSALPKPVFELMREAGVLARHGEGWRSLVRLSSLQGQLFFHSAYPTQETDAVFLGPDTYRYAAAIRRHVAAQASKPKRAVDIGCGNGAGAILLALDCPGAQVIAVDINDAALMLTDVNARLAGVPGVVTRNSNLLRATQGKFDLVIANPPYLLDPTERAYRHGGGSLGEGLSLAIVDAALERLAPGGSLLLYTGVAIVNGQDRFFELVSTRLGSAGVEWDYEELDPDVFGEELVQPAYAQADRIAVVLLTVRAAAQ